MTSWRLNVHAVMTSKCYMHDVKKAKRACCHVITFSGQLRDPAIAQGPRHVHRVLTP